MDTSSPDGKSLKGWLLSKSRVLKQLDTLHRKGPVQGAGTLQSEYQICFKAIVVQVKAVFDER
jgi:hypothetical protein